MRNFLHRLVPALLLVAVATAQAPSGADTSVRWIARTLDRLGEKALAQRFLRDYTQNKVISFGDLGGDANAETGRGWSGKNEITLDNSMLKIADLERTYAKRPYGPQSVLVSAAVTIFHEYQHMDQTRPQNIPKFEDPAWLATDAALNRWVRLLQTQIEAIAKEPASASRTQRLAEANDLLRQLKVEVTALKDAIKTNEGNGSLSKGLKWRFSDTASRIAAAQKRIGAPAAAAPKPVADKAWVLVQTVPYNTPPSDANYQLSWGEGKIGWKWSLGSDVFAFDCTWTLPPKVIRPDDEVKLTLAVSLTQNDGEAYSANGTFDVWFDHPDCEPGSVISPTGFRAPAGQRPGIAVTHRKGVPPPAPVEISIKGSELPGARDGGRIALMVCAYNGRNAGIKYIYEWRKP